MPEAQVLGPGERPTLPFPVVVKPIDADNSVAVSARASTRTNTTPLPRRRWPTADAVLVETYVELGREVRCGIIVRDGELVCCRSKSTRWTRPANPSERARTSSPEQATATCTSSRKTAPKPGSSTDDHLLTQRVWAAARRCHLALGCRHYSLFDFRIDPDGRPWFLEAGLYCSYSPGSVIAMMASAAGIGLRRTIRDRPQRNESRSHAVLDVTALTPVGARLTGLRVDTLSAATAATVRRFLAEHGVDRAAQSAHRRRQLPALPASFGPTMFTVGETPVPGHPELNVVSNVGRGRPPRSSFHTDTSYVRDPRRSPLYGRSPCRSGAATRCSPTSTRHTKRCLPPSGTRYAGAA